MTIPANKNVPDGIYEVAPNDNYLLYTTLSNFIGITDSQYCRACLNVRRISIFRIAYNRLDRGTVYSDFIDYKRRRTMYIEIYVPYNEAYNSTYTENETWINEAMEHDAVMMRRCIPNVSRIISKLIFILVFKQLIF